MPYNPSINDISGQLYAQYMLKGSEAKATGITEAARIKAAQRAASDEAISRGISQAGTAIGGGIGDLIGAYGKESKELDYLTGAFKAQEAMGLVSPEMRKKFDEGNLGMKRQLKTYGDMIFEAGIKESQAAKDFGRTMDLHYFDRQTQAQQAQIDRDAEVAERKRQEGLPGSTTQAIDPVTKRPFGVFRSSPQQAQPIVPPRVQNPPSPTATADGFIVPDPNSKTGYRYLTDEQGNRIKPPAAINPWAFLQPGMQPPAGTAAPPAATPGYPPAATPSATPQPSATPSATPQPSVSPSTTPSMGAPTPQRKGKAKPIADAIPILKANPTEENKRLFDETYGAGAAAQVLGK